MTKQTLMLVKNNRIVFHRHVLLDKLINNPELRAAFGERGFKRATDNFSIEKYVQKIEDIFKNN